MSVHCRLIAYAAHVDQNRVQFPFNFDTGMCWGGFLALQQTSLFVDENNRHSLEICMPPETTLPNMMATFVRYVDAHPQDIGEQWIRVAHRSLIQAFPCPKLSAQPG